jgi:hypothetical protein
MAKQEIAAIVLKQLRDHPEHSLPDVVKRTLRDAHGEIYSDDVKSVVFGLILNKEVETTNDLKVRLVKWSIFGAAIFGFAKRSPQFEPPYKST